jgi:hypothetical protein
MRQVGTLKMSLLLGSRDYHQPLAEVGLRLSRWMRQRHEYFLVLQPGLVT